MKYTGNYTKDTAKAIKAAEKLICTTTEDGAIGGLTGVGDTGEDLLIER